MLLILLISTIFSSLISCNYCTVIDSVDNSNVYPSNKIKELNYSKDWKSVQVAAILTKPSSRAYNCFLKTNYDCSMFEKEDSAGRIIGSADFLEGGPRDGRIASAGNPLYDVLDEHRDGRWNPSDLKIKEHNITHFVTEIVWTLKEKRATIDNVQVFLSNENYTEGQSIQRSLLNLICSYDAYSGQVNVENYTFRFDCYIEQSLVKESLFYGAKNSGAKVLLSTLKLAGTNYAFYQVADVSVIGRIGRIVNYHAYVSDPLSRAKLCQLRINHNCGRITYEPQSVEGFKGFPDSQHSPPDGKIASGNNARFGQLDEYGANRWTKVKFPQVNCHNATHVSINLTWYFTAVHSTDDFRVYISNENYTTTEPLARRHFDLNPLSTIQLHGQHPPRQLTMVCPISYKKYYRLSKLTDLVLLNIWNVYDTSFAFYQVVDLQGPSVEQSYENILRKCY